jgi:leucine-rich repeat protein SHOC2
MNNNLLDTLPSSIYELTELKWLHLASNLLTALPRNIDRLTNLKNVDCSRNSIASLPERIGNLKSLVKLSLSNNRLRQLPDSIGDLCSLGVMDLANNLLTNLPAQIGNLDRLHYLNLANNQLTQLPDSFSNLTGLAELDLQNNPIDDLSILQQLPNLKRVMLLRANLPRRYWTKFSDWQPQWLLDERNVEIRRRLVDLVGYEKICDRLNAKPIDTWREYTLLKIDNVEIVYERWREVGKEPMVLLKMTCPSTGHVHILRVPPTMTSAEVAIVWVNHGIHPDEIATQT